MSLADLSAAELSALHDDLTAQYADLKAAGLKLDLTRGKPSAEQLDLSAELLSLPGPDRTTDASGTDVRNYGNLQGLREIREIFGELLGIGPDQLIAADNSSLSIMHDSLVFALLHGRPGGDPWSGQQVKVLCPTPGYDRHFALSQELGFELVPVDLTADGPDLETIKKLVADDPQIKAIWVVPTYANPNGAVYSEEITRELVSMPTAAEDFTLLWDNAYAVHHLTDSEITPVDVLGLAAAAGNADRVFVYASSSKISFAGAGVSFFGGSPSVVDWYLAHLAKRTIGPDKINQLRHALYLKNADGVRDLMRKHRAIIGPKFEAVQRILTERLGDRDVATWTEPQGGYFISLDVAEGTATEVVRLAKEAGIALTPAGSAYPYGRDPGDRNIRIAPTFPPLPQVTAAIDGLATCVLLAAVAKLRQ
ncbi:PLP-dependent aminotransferase family protein [Microlunatus soli]|uniref:DNA-binding transcriptional regulator, MocR family, contains an aminotransferase domain n=1 Tax=Microlunatus soli TaxID=630515 RepID=A0A1H1WHC1_9ACTN|nr:aminotransferase [Microlunatus soli]SDS95666.1 DNA-binding transcriptional regulator, MocR family, contains an aminotransferase domain [Microlunatus soli]